MKQEWTREIVVGWDFGRSGGRGPWRVCEWTGSNLGVRKILSAIAGEQAANVCPGHGQCRGETGRGALQWARTRKVMENQRGVRSGFQLR